MVLGRFVQADEALWSIRVVPAPRLDPVLVLVGAPRAARLTAVAWARAVLKDLHPDRPAACVLVGDPPRLLAPVGPAPRCLPTDGLLLEQGEGAGDLAAALELVWAELSRCAERAGQAVPDAGARVCVIGGPWSDAGQVALTELEALGVSVQRVGVEPESDPPAVPPPDGASLTDLLAALGVVDPAVRGRIEVSLSEAPRRWWASRAGGLVASPPTPPPRIDIPLLDVTLAVATPLEVQGTVRLDLADGTTLVTALEAEAAGSLDPDLLAALQAT